MSRSLAIMETGQTEFWAADHQQPVRRESRAIAYCVRAHARGGIGMFEEPLALQLSLVS